MAQRRPDRPTLVETHTVTLADGREAKVREYDDGSVRFRLDRTPYAMTECYLSGGSTQSAIIKLEPMARAEPPAEDE